MTNNINFKYSMKKCKIYFIILKYKVTLYYKKQIKNLVNNNIY